MTPKKPDDDPVVKAEQLARFAAEKAEKNRQDFPEISRVVDLFKAAFGADQIRVTYAKEGDKEKGAAHRPPVDRMVSAANMAWTYKPEARSEKRRTKKR
ncbi:MAG: hypothetical protein ACYDEV_04130 [Acidiferrobacter sp.]